MSKKQKIPVPKKLPKRLRQAHRSRVPTLDLHNLSLEGSVNVEIVITQAIDNFVREYLYKENIEIHIIVGRGINSNPDSFIEQVPVLRFYTSKYLTQLRLVHSYYESNGIFVVRF